MELQDYKHVEEPAQENSHCSNYKIVLGFDLYMEIDFIPYLIS